MKVPPFPSPGAAAQADLAPGGNLRVGLNLANFLLVRPGVNGAEPSGVAPDIARELGRRLGVPVEFVHYDAPAKLADGVAAAECRLGFLAAEPSRETSITFTPAYVEIEATYLVPAASTVRDIAEIDQPGTRISVVSKSAYELWLSRHIQRAQLVHTANVDESFRAFVEQKLEALSGLRPRLVVDAEKLPGSRILEGRFTAIQQAIGVPRSCTAAAAYLYGFVEDIKRSGLVAEIIARHEVHGITVAPTAD